MSYPPVILVTQNPNRKEKQMARAVSVKIPTSKVIEMVEAKLEEMKQTAKEYPKLLEAYEKDLATISNKIMKIVKDNIGKDGVLFYNNYSGASISVGKNLIGDIEFPEKPLSPDNYQTKQNKEQLEKTLKLLNLTAQESVTSSTYNSVLDLI
jgi:hypothetical protein